MIDVYQNSPEHKELGEQTTSAVELVQALHIVFNNKRGDMYFYGVGFHPINVAEVYDQLKWAVLSYQQKVIQLEEKQKHEATKGPFGISNLKLPKIEPPSIRIQIGRPRNSDTKKKAIADKKAIEQGKELTDGQ